MLASAQLNQKLDEFFDYFCEEIYNHENREYRDTYVDQVSQFDEYLENVSDDELAAVADVSIEDIPNLRAKTDAAILKFYSKAGGVKC